MSTDRIESGQLSVSCGTTEASFSIPPILALSWQSMGYGLGIIGRQLVLYLTLPAFTHYMPQAEFGLVAFAMAVMAFVNTLTNAGLPAATYRFYHDGDDSQGQRQVLGASLGMFTLFATVPAVGFFLFASPIAQSLLGSSSHAQVIRLIAILLVIDTLVNYGYILLRIQIRPLATSLSSMFVVTVQMGSALVLVCFFDWGAKGYLTGLLLGEMVGLVLLTFLTRKMISFSVSRRTMTMLLRYGLPLLPAALSMWALHLADRTLVSQTMGLDRLAIYEVGYKMGALVTLAAAPFRVAWPPFAFSVMRKPNAQAIYRDVVTYLLFASSFFAMGLLAFKAEILGLLAPASYSAALPVVEWVALAQVFLCVQMVLSIGPKISKRTFDLTIVTVLAAVLYLALLVVLIPLLGIVGAAVATATGYGLLAFASYGIGQRSYPFPLDWSRLFKVVLAAGSSYLLIQVTDSIEVSGWVRYLFKTGAWLSFPVIAVLFGVVTPLQLRGLWRLVSTMLQTRFQRLDKVVTRSP